MAILEIPACSYEARNCSFAGARVVRRADRCGGRIGLGMASGELVSVVIPAYNAAKLLPETLEGALSQSHENCEIILVDDGSTDDTAAVVAPYLQRIRFIQRDHAGIGPTRNAGIEAAKGDYIAFLDADDIWLPDKVAIQLDTAKRNPESGLIACDGVEFDGPRITKPHLLSAPILAALLCADGGELTADVHRAFVRNCMISCPAQVMLPRWAMQEISPLEDSWAQDYEIYLRVSQLYPVTFHADQLVRWRYSSGSASGPRADRSQRWAEMGVSLFESQQKRCKRADRRLYSRRIKHMTRLIASFDRRDATGKTGLFQRLSRAGLVLTRRLSEARELLRLFRLTGERPGPAASLGLRIRYLTAILFGRPVSG